MSTNHNPFQKAATLDKRPKVFLWGDSGVGKTTLALHFPSPVVIDLEGGTDLYGSAFEFDVMRAASADEVMKAVDWLASNEHGYRTLIIDPITVYWDALQRKWQDIFLKRNTKSRGNRGDWYELQPKDWQIIKAELKELIRKLTDLDMGVVVTGREKPLYDEGEMLKKIGTTYDGEKSLPYLFDTVVRLYRDERGRFLAEAKKDRTNRLPRGVFEPKYEVFAEAFGATLERPARPVAQPAPKPAPTTNGNGNGHTSNGVGISDAQRRMLYAIAKDALPEYLQAEEVRENIKATMRVLFSKDSTTQLTRAEFDALLAHYKQEPPPQEDDDFGAAEAGA